MTPAPTLDIEELERLREKLVSGHYVTAKAEYEGALHRAAPALIAAARRAEHAERFCNQAAVAAGDHGFVCAETVPLRAEIARLREALKAAEGEKEAVDRHYNAVCKALGHWRGRSSPASETARKLREALEAAERSLSALVRELRHMDGFQELHDAHSTLALIRSGLGTEGEGK